MRAIASVSGCPSSQLPPLRSVSRSTEGYVTGIALDENNEVIGYQFVSLGKMTDFIKKGDDPNTAWEKAKGQYGRVADAVKIIDPREE